MTPEQIRIVLHGLTAVGFLFMCIVPFVPHRGHQRWAKIQFLLMSVLAVSWGVLGIVRDVYHLELSRDALWRLDHYKTIIGGLWMGLLISLFLSGQIICSKAKQLQGNK